MAGLWISTEAFVHYAFISPLNLMLHFFHLNARFPPKKSLKCSVNVHTWGFLTVQSVKQKPMLSITS